MTPFPLETQLAAKIAQLPEDTLIRDALERTTTMVHNIESNPIQAEGEISELDYMRKNAS